VADNYRIFDGWSDWDTQQVSNFTLEPVTVGIEPWLDVDDDDAGYVEFKRQSGNITKHFVIKPPPGTNIASLGWLGDAYDPVGWPGSEVRPPISGVENFYRFETITRLRMDGVQPPFTGSHLCSFSDFVGGSWTGTGPFDLTYAALGRVPWSTSWITIYSGRSEPASSVEGRWQAASDAGTFGFKIIIGITETTYTERLGYFSLISPALGTAPRLRQRQRDDLRQRQADSRQLTARQRGYF
jgi:hypothetical protein